MRGNKIKSTNKKAKLTVYPELKYDNCHMKKELMDILACPVCKSSLKLKVTEEKEGEVITGSLFCKKCNHSYPITDSIPNLLPPNLKS